MNFDEFLAENIEESNIDILMGSIAKIFFEEGARQARTMMPVSERLPKVAKHYLTRHANGRFGDNFWDGTAWEFSATHWIELPEVPGC